MRQGNQGICAVLRFAATLLAALMVIGGPSYAGDDDDHGGDHGSNAASGKAKVVTVSCARGQSINKAIANAPRFRPLVVRIIGTCDENVSVTRNEVTLRGHDPASSGIRGVPETDLERESPITVLGAVDIVIENLTVSNGDSSGIVVDNSKATIRGSILENNARTLGGGIAVAAGGFARVDNVTVRNNLSDAGVNVFRGGSCEITNSRIYGNTGNGVQILDGGSARIGFSIVDGSGPTTIKDNSGDGIRLFDGASARIRDSEISGNEGYGVQLFRSARAYLEGNNIHGNSPSAADGKAGVGVFQGSAATLVNNQITNHPNGYGVLVVDNGEVRMNSNTVDGSGAAFDFGAGVAVYRNSTVRMTGGNTVTNSDWAAIDVEQQSVFYALGGTGDTLTNSGTSAFGRPRLSIEVFNQSMADIRAGSTVTGAIDVGALSTLRSRDNTMTGNINAYGSAGVGLRNTVTYTGTISCSGNSFTFSNDGGPYDCNTSHP
jgi:parallel beta-helix repeat protein